MTATTTSSTHRLDRLDRQLLIAPTPAGLGLGLFPLFAAPLFARVTNYPPNDILIYRLAGAGTLGYGVGLLFGILQKSWRAVWLAVIAALIFNLAALYASVAEIARQLFWRIPKRRPTP
jgi:hypothetical protein